MHSLFKVNLRRALDERDWTQQGIARELNVSNRTVAGWCLGETLPQAKSLEALARTLELDVSWFFTDHDDRVAA